MRLTLLCTPPESMLPLLLPPTLTEFAAPAVHSVVSPVVRTVASPVVRTHVSTPVVSHVATPAVYSGVHSGVYSGLSSVYGHYYGKREAEAEPYTVGQVYAGLPVANAYA